MRIEGKNLKKVEENLKKLFDNEWHIPYNTTRVIAR